MGQIQIYEPVARNNPKQNSQLKTTEPENQQSILKLNKSFVVTPKQLLEDWEVNLPQELSEAHFLQLLKLEPELVILGTGKTAYFPPSKYCLILQQKGIGVEVMDTSAACRTYNFLVADGRNVAAALFML